MATLATAVALMIACLSRVGPSDWTLFARLATDFDADAVAIDGSVSALLSQSQTAWVLLIYARVLNLGFLLTAVAGSFLAGTAPSWSHVMIERGLREGEGGQKRRRLVSSLASSTRR